jgi:hypothetical protein
MQTRARFHEIETFGDADQFNKAVFLDLETMDKVSMMLGDKQVVQLAPMVGKDGVLSIGLVAKGYDYSVKFKGFKVAA